MKGFKKLVLLFLIVIGIGLLYPQHYSMPVEGALKSSYNPHSFWYYPWGISGTHKGVDIFARQGTPIRSTTSGLVLYTGQLKLGGNIVLVLDPK